MKKITILCCFITLFCIAQSKAQNENKWLFKVGANIVDNSGDTNPFNGLALKKMGFTNNIAAGVDYQFHEHWSVGLLISNNKFKAPDAELDGEFITENMNYFAADFNLKYYLLGKQENSIVSKRFNMYLSGGLGAFKIKNNTLSLNFGGGLIYWLNDSFGVNLESVAKWTTESGLKYDSNHFQHFAGITFRPQKKDSDKDGVVDAEDVCPNTFGLAAFNGCPDTDNDGIVDAEDGCPKVAGLQENNGCPDTDKDGVVDSLDSCKNTFGPKANNGCPYKDTDKDGVLDKDDACPNVKGIMQNKGCPKVEVKVIETPQVIKKNINSILKGYATSIYFNSGTHSFKDNAYIVLQEIADKLKQFPNSKILIEGHTDSIGNSNLNQILSQNRANEVKRYLIEYGGLQNVTIEAVGYGESKPIATNTTEKGRVLNRRVVLKVLN